MYILTGDVLNHLDFWEVDTQEKFRSLVGHTQTISGIDFSDDNQLMATSSWDGHIKIWNVLTGMITAKMGQKNHPVYAVIYLYNKVLSGGAINTIASRGADREKTIAQLARNTGTFFLTASQDAQYANESGDLKHGLFTYALLEVLTGKDVASSTDGKITINEIKTYVDERVPELSEKYHGSAQYPTSYSFGQDFPIVILK